MDEPEASRPLMPGYGILPAPDGSGLLPWEWAVHRLATSTDYWVATVWPDGRPQLTPVWGIWDAGALRWSSGPESRKARNLAADPRVVVSTADPHEPVVLEGLATTVTDPAALATFTAAVNAKYAVDYSLEFFTANALFALRPDVVIGLDSADFTGTPTRWRFPRRPG